MDEQTRKELHILLDRLIDEKQPIGTVAHMEAKDIGYNIITYHIFLKKSIEKKEFYSLQYPFEGLDC